MKNKLTKLHLLILFISRFGFNTNYSQKIAAGFNDLLLNCTSGTT